jgi:hypothetical protein
MLPSNHRVFGNNPIYILPEYSFFGIMQAFVALDFNID